ncbi:hypothetical protein ACHHYP_01174 [Achlya hypogyna]|uniref:Uncharacterized protein n=1 Tax=Achlya hypogyna TaxID=1202772 RepID=A0A1V9ZTP7_ACHHY|nr:hypothetical protein ACHHYP_01174 [Achlya hypogyna]
MAPLLWKERFALGWTGTKRVLALRTGAPVDLTFATNDALSRRQWSLMCTLGLTYTQSVLTVQMTERCLDGPTATALFRALKVNRSVLTLDVSGNVLGDEAVAALGVLLNANTTLTQLVARRTGLSALAIRSLTDGLQDNIDSCLLALDLSHNPLYAGSTQALADCLSVNETLTRLDLAATHIDEPALLEALRRNYTLLELHVPQIEAPEPVAADPAGRLAKDHLNTTHAPSVVEALRRATSGFAVCNLTGVALPIQTLKTSRWVGMPRAELNELDGLIVAGLLPLNAQLLELDLSSNALGAESVVAILHAIKACPTLRTADLSDNGIGDYIGEALGHSLTTNETLGTLKVAVLTHDIQQLRGHGLEAQVEELVFTKDMLANTLDYWIVTALLGVNRSTSVLNDLQVPPLEDHLDLCHSHIAEWVSLHDSVRIRHHVHLVVLQLNCCGLTSFAGVLLADALRNHTVLEFVSLEHNDLRQVGGRAIAEAMEHNHRLTHLNLSWNHLHNDGVRPFEVSLGANRALRRLDLRGNAIGTIGVVAISAGLAGNASLEELFLRWNDVGPLAATSLATALTKNKHLKVLDIEQQHMEVDGARAFGGMLRVNKALTALNLKSDLVLHPHTALGADGALALAAALRDNTTLVELNLAENRLSTEGCEAIISVLAQLRLKKFDLSYSELEGEVAIAFFGQLAHNKRLEELNVEHNNIGPDGFKACVRALCVNRTLRELNVGHNHITEEGMLLAEKQARLFALVRLRLVGNRVTPATKERLEALRGGVVVDI